MSHHHGTRAGEFVPDRLPRPAAAEPTADDATPEQGRQNVQDPQDPRTRQDRNHAQSARNQQDRHDPHNVQDRQARQAAQDQQTLQAAPEQPAPHNVQDRQNPQDPQRNDPGQSGRTRVIRRSRRADPDRPADELFRALGTTLSPELLVEALTHRSFAHEHPGTANYERLEFLGDAVLELVVTETLFTAHPDMTEGQLAKMRAKAVSEESLSRIARERLHVGPYILLGHGESDDGGADKSSILCDIVEALIGATFLEHGIDGAREVVHRLVDDTLAEVATEGPALDWKTSLTVRAHQLGLGEPRYRMEVSGPEYAQVFTARAMLGDSDEVLGIGSASSKRKAQLAAAEAAWRALERR